MNKTDFIFKTYAFNRRWSNASLLTHRDADGHIVSMQQSGSHWIKNLVSHVLMQRYGLPPMAHIQDDSIVGHTHTPPKYKNIPQIVHSHGYPHALTLRVPGLRYPRYLVLVRELKESLVSHYERFKGDYGNIDFSEYLHGDVRQNRFHSDIWTRIRFMNEWGRLIEDHPDEVMSLRYEDMKKDTMGALRRAVEFFRIPDVTEEILAAAVAACGKEQMAQKPNPKVKTTVVRTSAKVPFEAYFRPEDRAFFDATCRRYLKYDFGYGYAGNRREDS